MNVEIWMCSVLNDVMFSLGGDNGDGSSCPIGQIEPSPLSTQCDALERGGAEAPPVADEARRKPGEQRSLPNGREGRRLLRT